MRYLTLLLLVVGCGIIAPVKRATPGGITIVYDVPNDGDYRLSREKVREIDERWTAVLECIPPEARCTSKPPSVQIRGGSCNSYIDPYGVRVGGETVGCCRVVAPGLLGGLAHEFAHVVSCSPTHGKNSWSYKCGDLIDAQFRKMYPPTKCEGDR